MQHCYELRYKNVFLRPLLEDDIESLRKWRNKPDSSLYLRKIPFITKEMQIEWYREYKENEDEMIFAIIEDDVLKRLVGSLSLYQFNGPECLFGKILIGDNEAHGRKIGLNATMAAAKIAFEQLGINRVNLYVFPENIAACKTYQRAGFVVSDIHLDCMGRKEYIMTKVRGM